MKRLFVAILCAGALAAAAAVYLATRPAAPLFELPIVCEMPQRCFVEFYPDHEPGLSDYRCGNRTYDTHRGTDFRVRSPADFAAGIAVIAAAPGTVLAVRDQMEDIDVGELGRDKIAGRAGGNIVVLQHEGGWFSLYWHLRRGSVAVAKGDSVVAGQRLGAIGLSGDTNFPHLHFEVRQDDPVTGPVVDPFQGAVTGNDTCKIPSQRRLWSAKAMAALTYRAIDAVAGFAGRNPRRNDAIYGRIEPPRIGGELFFWFELFGVNRGDTIAVRFALPDGTLRPWQEARIDTGESYIYRSAGLNAQIELRAGTYGAILKLTRSGANRPAFEQRFEIEVR